MNIKNNIIARWCFQFIRPKPAYYHKVNTIGVIPEDSKSPRLIVSLTSFPARIKTVNYTIESILLQKKQANMVVLWLGCEQFPNKEKDLPKRLLRLTQFGLSIKWCKDIRSYKKLVPSLEEFPDDIIVTADDDIWYPPEWLERLYDSYLKEPTMIHAHRVLQVTANNGIINKYIDWGTQIFSPQEPSYCWHFTGCGGVLYPPHCLYKDVCIQDKFLSMAYDLDDVWFWVMAILQHTRIRIVDDNIFTFEGVFIVNNQSLWDGNVFDKNDVALNKLIKAYPELKQLLQDDLARLNNKVCKTLKEE